MNTLRVFPKMVIAVGIVFALSGLVAAGAGIYIRTFVGRQLAAQQITTPEDASIPNAPVTSIATALSMADIIQHHAAASSNGLTYAQMGRFAVASGDPAHGSGGAKHVPCHGAQLAYGFIAILSVLYTHAAQRGGLGAAPPTFFTHPLGLLYNQSH